MRGDYRELRVSVQVSVGDDSVRVVQIMDDLGYHSKKCDFHFRNVAPDHLHQTPPGDLLKRGIPELHTVLQVRLAGMGEEPGNTH